MVLLTEHIFSYLFGIWRDYEIKKKGKPNKYGIESAPIEFRMRIIEVLADLVIFIFILNHFTALDRVQFNDLPLLNYWMLVDMIIMFLTLPYTYMSRLMMITGEIIKNIFTLY
tara:strand:+ start:731 stop:1069 length:339 start_codon:yes stop_codon:yes gene_type:complete